ncbi:MAG: hypothetical protein IKD90_09075 [Clostridiales bacterium]|nr:hypothetical protein [Clostridiales bacterium]
MHEIAKHEFLSWVDTLETEQLSEHEITMLSILISNFEEVASVGTASGQRAKLLSQKITELNKGTVKDLPQYEINEMSDSVIKRIESLDVEKFRGFGAIQSFTFDKQYTFFHGPNGSGKTSFCEALEYCILGTIEEATARNIATEKFIVHAGEKKAHKPTLKCKFSSGEIDECQPDYSKYRFGFIEKNRIDGFSHISAATTKTQTERLAALFGLSEFQEFVKGFTSADVFGNDKYLKVNAVIQTEYEKENGILGSIEVQVKEAEEKLKTEKEELAILINALNNPEIKTVDDVEKYFMDPNNGLITKYLLDADKNKWVVIKNDTLDLLASDLTVFIGYYEDILKSNSEILSDVGAVNLVTLFNAIAKLNADEYDKCPVCNTPLTAVKVNPFENAKEELKKLEQIELAKNTVRGNAKKIIDNYERIFTSIESIKQANVLGMINYSLFENQKFQQIEVESLAPEIISVFDELKKLKANLVSEDTAQIVEEYNTKAANHNKQYDEKLDKAQKEYKEIVGKNGSVGEKQNGYNALIKSVKDTKAKVEALKKKVDSEKVEIDFNKKMVEAYESIVEKLSTYVATLPTALAQNLSEKALEYYNCINEDDADFELIKELHLPLAVNEKITIEMEDGVSQDALLILSEGHVKILGLSILLAKAVSEGIPFLIFDDIVNSVDDDHRDGVAKLLITHTDFANTQMILTCHGEMFVSMLEGYVSNSNSMTRYMFLPADTLDERGVFIKYQDPSIPLEVAKKKYEENQLKDSAMSCRRAVECTTGKLWKKLSPCIGGISVKLRNLQGQPDLFSITSALYDHTKGKYIQDAEEINEDLKKLMEASSWSKLNKGTHEDKSIPEFTRGEVKQLLELVEKLAKDVEEVKIKATVV